MVTICKSQDREASNDDGHSASGSQGARQLDPAKQVSKRSLQMCTDGWLVWLYGTGWRSNEHQLTCTIYHHTPSLTNAQAQRVYVGNLSWNVDREQLRQHMAEAGEVTFAEVLTEPSGRSKVHYWSVG